MGNISSIFGSSVGKANLSPSSLRRLDNRSNGSSSVYGGGNSSCGVSNASESFIDNSFSNPSDDEDGQINHDNDNHSSNSSYSQEEYEYVHVNEVAGNDAIDDDYSYVLVAGAMFNVVQISGSK